jgi:hypothetical protein
MTIKSTLIASALAITLPLAPALAGGNGGHGGGTVVVHGNGGWHGGNPGWHGGGWNNGWHGGGGWGCGWGCGASIGLGAAALGALAWGLSPGYGYAAPPVVVRQPQLVCNQFGQCWYQ